jgi:hypothetical protein
MFISRGPNENDLFLRLKTLFIFEINEYYWCVLIWQIKLNKISL